MCLLHVSSRPEGSFLCDHWPRNFRNIVWKLKKIWVFLLYIPGTLPLMILPSFCLSWSFFLAPWFCIPFLLPTVWLWVPAGQGFSPQSYTAERERGRINKKKRKKKERKPCESIYRHIKDRKIYILFTSEKPFISNKQFPWAFKKHDLSFVGYHASATKTTRTAKTTLFQPFRSHFHTCTTDLNFSRQQHWRICVWEHKSPYQSDRILNWPHPASSLCSVMSTSLKQVRVQVPSIMCFLWSTRPCLTQNRFFSLVWHKQSTVY